MNIRLLQITAAVVATLLVAACTVTRGLGTASSRSGDVRANFLWNSTDDHSGTMSATLGSGETYSGRFFQITQDTRVETLDPLWVGWRGGFRGWRYWGPEADSAFVTHYSGRVVANLEGENGTHMRCRFDLVQPFNGMAGGGEGVCQLPSGKSIDANFPKA